MKKSISGFLFLLVIVGGLSGQSPVEIYEKVLTANKLPQSEGVSTLTIIDKRGNERVRQIAQISKLYNGGELEKTLVKFLSPADVKGTGLLTFNYTDKDDDMWLYLPALRKTRRIVSSEKGGSFMGSEFSYADLSPGESADFTISSLGEESVDGTNCYKIELKPKSDDIADENGFFRKILWVAKTEFIPRKVELYDYNDELEKVITFKNIELVKGASNKYAARELEIKNVQKKRSSRMEIKQLQVRDSVDESYFSQQSLSRK